MQDEHRGFRKGVEVRLIDKIQGFDPTKKEYYYYQQMRFATENSYYSINHLKKRFTIVCK